MFDTPRTQHVIPAIFYGILWLFKVHEAFYHYFDTWTPPNNHIIYKIINFVSIIIMYMLQDCFAYCSNAMYFDSSRGHNIVTQTEGSSAASSECTEDFRTCDYIKHSYRIFLKHPLQNSHSEMAPPVAGPRSLPIPSLSNLFRFIIELPNPFPSVNSLVITNIPVAVLLYATYSYYMDFTASRIADLRNGDKEDVYDFIIVGGGSAGKQNGNNKEAFMDFQC